ncbi:PA3496 family putative envelope integrity protein [Agarilytica rhodophyticola]|uniref:PA3496 family putative envelope integrity protein n=1 Tax=Agarilytica rhodophyticola TaxID=1737490 RepID=UPI00156F48A8|nr:hypothetical protein [Agarilytica rhodophyticola]
MGVEVLEPTIILNSGLMDDSAVLQDEPLNGTDARRRLEDKIEELRLQRELQEFDFDL